MLELDGWIRDRVVVGRGRNFRRWLGVGYGGVRGRLRACISVESSVGIFWGNLEGDEVCKLSGMDGEAVWAKEFWMRPVLFCTE